MTKKQESSKLGLLTLLASTSTLICCALPALFVTLGAGATFASMVNAFPHLVIISHYKVFISLATLIILVIAGLLIEKSKYDPCPVDQNLRYLFTNKKKDFTFTIYLWLYLYLLVSLHMFYQRSYR